MENKKLFLIIAVVAILGFITYSFYQVFVKNKNAFDQANTTVTIDGPKSLDLGSTANFVITLKNNNKANLKNTNLTLTFNADGFSDIKDESGFGNVSGSSITWNIAEGISAGYEGTIKASAKVMDISANKISASLDYEPENFSSKFSAKSDYGFTINPAKISLSLYAPKEVVTGQEAKYSLVYTNATAVDFDMVRLKFNYPEGFTFASSNPPAGENGTWEIQNFTKAASGQIEVTGNLAGNGGETKTVSAVIEQKTKDGQYAFNNSVDASTSLISSPFSVNETINDKEGYSVSSGDLLNYKIKFRNMDKVDANNLIVSVVLGGDAADYTTLTAEKGTVDKQQHSVIWDSKANTSLKNLKPDQEAELDFSIKVQDKLPIVDTSSRNFTIKNLVKIENGNIFNADGSNKVIVNASFETKVNSSVMLFARGFYNDDGERLKTSGPIPPQVGQTTAYNIHWQIFNTSNKIKNVKVTGILPPNVRWTGSIFPTDSKISYDVNTRTVTWEAGDIDPGAGILSPLKEALFQVNITPAAGDIGSYLVLIDQNSLSATDDFTLSEVSAHSEGITTRLPDDISIGPDEGKVVQ